MVVGLGVDLVELDRVERRSSAGATASGREADGPAPRRRACRPREPSACRALALAIAGKEAASKALGHRLEPGRALARRGGGPRPAPACVAGGPRAVAAPARSGRAAPRARALEVPRRAGAGRGPAARVSAAPAPGPGRNQYVMVADRVRGLHRLRVRAALPAALRARAGRRGRRARGALGRRADRRGAAAGGPAGAGLGPAGRPLRPQADGGARARLLRGAARALGRRQRRLAALRAAHRHRALRRHRAAGPGDGHLAGAARGDGTRGGPRPGRADPVRGGRARWRAASWPTPSASAATFVVTAAVCARRAGAGAARYYDEAPRRRGRPPRSRARPSARCCASAGRAAAAGGAVPRELHRPLVHADPAPAPHGAGRVPRRASPSHRHPHLRSTPSPPRSPPRSLGRASRRRSPARAAARDPGRRARSPCCRWPSSALRARSWGWRCCWGSPPAARSRSATRSAA